MKNKSALLLLLLLGLSGPAKNSANPNSSPLPEPIRAWQVSQVEFSDFGQFGGWLKKLKASGVNTIIVKVFQNPGDGFHKLCSPRAQSGFYFQTNAAPVVCDLTGAMAQEAHRAGLKFYAWINTRSADYGIEQRTDLHSWYYDLQRQNYRPGPGLCVFHPEVRSRLIQLYYDLSKNPIDGVLVQDDLMLKHNEDFHPLALHLYQKDRGKTVSPEQFYLVGENGAGKKLVKDYTREFREWNDWKIKQLLDLADLLRKAVQANRPEAKFGLNFYYETALKPDQARAWFSQDLKTASGRNYDFYSLMLYHRQVGGELGISGPELDQAVATASQNFLGWISGPEQPVIKLMCKDFKNAETIPAGELRRMIGVIPGRSRAGLVFFPAMPGRESELKGLFQAWEKEDGNEKMGNNSGGFNHPDRMQK